MTKKYSDIILDIIHVTAKSRKLKGTWTMETASLTNDTSFFCGYSYREIKAMNRREIAAIPELDEFFTMIETEMEKHNEN